MRDNQSSVGNSVNGNDLLHSRNIFIFYWTIYIQCVLNNGQAVPKFVLYSH